MIQPLLQPGHQRCAVGLPILRRTKTVDFQLEATNAQLSQQIPGQSDHFHIAAGALRPQPLHTDLMKLTLATGLGPLIAEHRAGVPKLLGALAQQAVLQRRPHHRRGALWPQCAGTLTAIGEAVHLLAHHIGAFADATAEQIGGFQQRCSDLAETGAAEMLPGDCFDGLPALQSLRQQIHHAPEALQLTHDTGCWFSGPVCPSMLRSAPPPAPG